MIFESDTWSHSSGQERYRSLTGSYFRGAMGILVCYDTSSDVDQTKGLQRWLDIIEKSADADPVIVIVGTKIDKCQAYNGVLNEEYEEVMTRGEDLAKEMDLPCILTSSVLSVNVRAAFMDVVHTLKMKGKLRPTSPTAIAKCNAAAQPDVVRFPAPKDETLCNAEKPGSRALASCACKACHC